MTYGHERPSVRSGPLKTLATSAMVDVTVRYPANWNAWRAYRLDPLIGPVLEQREERARTATLFTGRPWYARTSALIVSSARSLIDFWLPVIIGFVAILASVLFVPTKPTVAEPAGASAPSQHSASPETSSPSAQSK